MTLAKENALPTVHDPISAKEAAALYDRVFDKSTKVSTFRVWLAENDDRVRGFTFMKVEDTGWIIDRASMLDVIEAWADRVLFVVEQERAGDKTNEGEK